VLGNKLDLADEGYRRVPTQKATDYCKNNGDMIFYETSAKNSINVEHAFTQLAIEAMKR
jgi:GTPase SAR1 family protein